MIAAYEATAETLLALGLPPAPFLPELRAMWRNGGHSRGSRARHRSPMGGERMTTFERDLAEQGRLIAERIAAQSEHAVTDVTGSSGSSETDGAALLNDVEKLMRLHLAFSSEHHYTVLVLWTAHTWPLSAFYVTPRLLLDSPEPGSGKTRVLEVLALLCRGAKVTLSTTTAALYRRIEAAGDAPPTVLQDEADAIFGKSASPQSEDLRAVFNAGYKRGATVDRCEGDAKNMKVKEFPVFAPVALAGLAGKMPRTIIDRAVTLHMRRRAPDEELVDWRERDALAAAEPLKERLAAWATANLAALSDARPAMPTGVRDRPAECWEALLAVADVAGGVWPARARSACKHFVLDRDPDELSFGLRLLRDIKTAFGDRDRMFSEDIVRALTKDDESEWTNLWGKPIDQYRLAKELKRYGVKPATIRIGEGRAKGYRTDGDDGLGQVWHRYLSNAGIRDKRANRDIAGQSVTDANSIRDNRANRDASVTEKTHPDLHLLESVTDGTDVTDTTGNRRFTPSTGPGGCDECHHHTATQGHADGCPQQTLEAV
jgi:hypothetical protein